MRVAEDLIVERAKRAALLAASSHCWPSEDAGGDEANSGTRNVSLDEGGDPGMARKKRRTVEEMAANERPLWEDGERERLKAEQRELEGQWSSVWMTV
jgi:hypothetical protein